jgi:hypothetical protein
LANSLEKTFINKAFWPKRIKNYFFYFFKNLLALENLKIIFASFSGIVVGIVINPYFPKNISFYWQQLVEIGLINYRGLVNVGGEWYPYDILNLIPDSGVAFILAVVALILFIIFIKKQKAENVFLLIATFLFLFLTLKSKRYVEYFIPFLVYFTAFTGSSLLAEIKLKDYLENIRKEIPVFKILEKPLHALLLVFILIMAKDAFITHQAFLGGIGFQNFAGISDYLIKNSKPGQIIMQTDWDDFPMLFYQNDKNYYIVGLDPTFMYNYDAKLYNLFADITTAKKTDNLYQAITENFKASYFVVDSDRSQLARNLQNDGNFFKVYEDNDGAIYAASGGITP